MFCQQFSRLLSGILSPTNVCTADCSISECTHTNVTNSYDCQIM
uniref:Uncharacterized protein n=1 Tax=Anguilla anguilla TaxID=7936 RepID=A0A0E9SV86_ANGAN